jgi:hypothetical protein
MAVRKQVRDDGLSKAPNFSPVDPMKLYLLRNLWLAFQMQTVTLPNKDSF